MNTPSMTPCPPIDLVLPPIPIAEWQPAKGLRCSIPVHLRSFKAGQWCSARNGLEAHAHMPEEAQLPCRGPGPDSPLDVGLLWAKPVGPYIIAAVAASLFCAWLIHTATSSVVKQIVMRAPWDSDFKDSVEGLVQRRARAIATAELAALVLKEQRVGGRRQTDGEVWLRRQLDGLGQTVEGG